MFAILAMTILFLFTTLAAIYTSSYLSLKNQSEEMLERYVDSFSLTGEFEPDLPETLPRGNEQPHPEDGVLHQLSSFYSVAYSEKQEIITVDTGWSGDHTEEEVISFARELLSLGKKEGTHSHMLYRVEKKDDYTLVAFMDTLLMEDSMREVLIHTLIVGVAAVILFFAASVILAGWIIRPLEENDRRQKQFVSAGGHSLPADGSSIPQE